MLIYKRVKKVCGRNLGFSPLERMQMEFPVETATGTNVQVLAYINALMGTFWFYDFVCSLYEEWTLLPRSRWTIKGIYIIARCIPLVLIIPNFLALVQNGDQKKCQILNWITICIRMYGALFIIVRTAVTSLGCSFRVQLFVIFYSMYILILYYHCQ